MDYIGIVDRSKNATPFLRGLRSYVFPARSNPCKFQYLGRDALNSSLQQNCEALHFLRRSVAARLFWRLSLITREPYRSFGPRTKHIGGQWVVNRKHKGAVRIIALDVYSRTPENARYGVAKWPLSSFVAFRSAKVARVVAFRSAKAARIPSHLREQDGQAEGRAAASRKSSANSSPLSRSERRQCS
jgi:hypothetical protein